MFPATFNHINNKEKYTVKNHHKVTTVNKVSQQQTKQAISGFVFFSVLFKLWYNLNYRLSESNCATFSSTVTAFAMKCIDVPCTIFIRSWKLSSTA